MNDFIRENKSFAMSTEKKPVFPLLGRRKTHEIDTRARAFNIVNGA